MGLVHPITHLHRDSSGTGAHGDRPHLHQEVAVSVAGAAALHFVALGVLEMALEFQHEHIEIDVCCESGPTFKQGHAAEGSLRVVHDIQQLGRLAWEQLSQGWIKMLA